MGVLKEVETNSGVVARYHRVVATFMQGTYGKVTVMLFSYLDKAARDSGKNHVNMREVELFNVVDVPDTIPVLNMETGLMEAQATGTSKPVKVHVDLINTSLPEGATTVQDAVTKLAYAFCKQTCPELIGGEDC